MFNDLTKLAEELDEHIEKGLKLEKRSELKKGLSHDPFRPHDMGFDSPYYNPYKYQAGEGYMPYEASHWEAFGKDPNDYLTTTKMYNEFRSLTSNIKDRTNGALDKSFGKLKALSKALENMDLEKAGAMPMAKPPASAASPKPSTAGSGMGSNRGLPIGTIHTYADGNRYKKVAQGQWVPMAGMEQQGHAKWLAHFNPKTKAQANDQLELHAQDHAEKTKKIQDEIDKRHSAEEQHRASIHAMASELSKFKDISPEFKGHLNKIMEAHSEKKNKEKLLSGTEKKINKKKAATKPHSVAIKLRHKGKDYDHVMKNIEAESPEAAEKLATEGIAQIPQLRGHEIKSVKATESMRSSGIFEPEDSLGIARNDMPQVASKDMDEFFDFLGNEGIPFTSKQVKLEGLKPSQKEINADAASAIPDSKVNNSIISSKDGYVIDGHHRWYKKKLDGAKSIQTVEIGMNAKELLEKMKDFQKVGMIDVNNKRRSTDEVFKRDGKYIESRKKIHDKILKGIVDNVQSIPPPVGAKPMAIFTAGGPGSGKSSMVKAAHDKFGNEMAEIAADEVKKDLPEYAAELARGNEDAAIVVHEESTDIAAEAIERCIESNKPFLLDSTFKNVPKFKKMIARLREKGFDVHVFYAHCTEDEAVKRAVQRQKDTGRKVEESVVRGGNKAAREAIYELAPLCDSASVFDTMADGAPPPSLAYHGKTGEIKTDHIRQIVKSDKQAKPDLFERFLDQVKTGKYEIEHDDDQSDIPIGQRLEYTKDDESDNKSKGESNEQK
jgi:predicted ABC-type ATPase